MRPINSSTSPSHSFLTAGAALTAGAGLLALASAACSSSSDSSGTGISGSSGSGNSGSAGSGAVSFGGSGGASTGGSGFGGVGGGGKGGVSGSGFGGTGGITTGGSGGIGTGGTGGTGSTAPPCLTNPSVQGVIIGDSYVTGAGTPALQPELAKLYPTAQQFRPYAVAGTSMASGGIPLLPMIPAQFDQAVTANPDIKFVLMDGGGNDVLICDGVKYPNCGTLCLASGSSTQPVCQQIVNDALTAATNLMTKMANDGVRDVIYFFYPHIPPSTARPDPNEILDYAYTLSGPACDSALSRTGGKLACHFIDLRQPFADNGGYSNISTDGIHPTLSGQDIIAAQVWNVMQRDCVGMTGGCCTP